MLAIKFRTDVHNDVIEIPPEHQALLKNHIEVIALIPEGNTDKVKKKNNAYVKVVAFNDLLGGGDLIEAILNRCARRF